MALKISKDFFKTLMIKTLEYHDYNDGDWVIFGPKTLINERIFDDSNEKSVVRHVFLG